MDWRSILPGFKVAIDGRSHLRDIGSPSAILVESSFNSGSAAEQINRLIKSDPIPMIFIDADSTVWVLTSGGSGLIMFMSPDANPMDDEQAATVDLVRSALMDHFAISSSWSKPKKKKKNVDVIEDLSIDLEEEQLIKEEMEITGDDSDQAILD